MQTRRTEIKALTGLRFIAAFYVLVFHLHLRKKLDFLPDVFEDFISQGALGVNIFFVLSGFILTYSYLSKTESLHTPAGMAKFMHRRVARIYPTYFAGFLLCLLVSYFLSYYPANFKFICVSNLLLIQSYWPKTAMEWYGSGAWSISTEFFFYLLFPVLLKLLGKAKDSRRLLTILIAMVLLGCIPALISGYRNNQDWMTAVYCFPPTRLPEFIAGMIGGLLVFRFTIRIKSFWGLAIVVVTAIYLALCGFRLKSYVAHNFLVIPCIVLLLLAIASDENYWAFRWLKTRVMVYLGRISYAMYIVQIPVLLLMDAGLESGRVSNFTYLDLEGILLIIVAGAALLHHFVEEPANKLMLRWQFFGLFQK